MYGQSLGQHYTDSDVAGLLSSLIDAKGPLTIVDLGVGQGSLLNAAKASWSDSALYGIDIDKKNLEASRALLGRGTFSQGDCLSPSLEPALKKLLASADIVLCNPPFLELDHPSARSSISRDWQHTAEAKFLSLSMQFLKPSGSLGIILPARYISGPAYRAFREQLVSTCNLVSVTSLPSSTFKTAQVETYFLVLRKELAVDGVSLQAIVANGVLATSLSLSKNEAIERMDYGFYAGCPAWSADAVPLSLLLTDDICRGNASSGRSTPDWMFHTSDFKRYSDGHLISHEVHRPQGRGVACKGDILIPRVGSRCLHHCAIVDSGQLAFSDCVYRLRVAPEWQAYVFAYLRSPAGVAMRKLVAHGSCAKLLGKQALLDLPVPMVSPEQLKII
jgi:methylase of polypeptide subunit release factors